MLRSAIPWLSFAVPQVLMPCRCPVPQFSRPLLAPLAIVWLQFTAPRHYAIFIHYCPAQRHYVPLHLANPCPAATIRHTYCLCYTMILRYHYICCHMLVIILYVIYESMPSTQPIQPSVWPPRHTVRLHYAIFTSVFGPRPVLHNIPPFRAILITSPTISQFTRFQRLIRYPLRWPLPPIRANYC